jgi:dTDP-glucose 4,6-dehydratase
MRSARILVTGAAGFILSHFARHVLDARCDWTVVGLDRLDEAGSQERLAPLMQAHPGRLRFVWHDLRAAINPALFSELQKPFDYVVHGAAMSHVNRAIEDPPAAVLDNVLGTAHLLEYCRRYQPSAKVLYFSTDEVFGPAADGVAFGEHARWEPENAYAATKAGGEALCPAYAHQYGMRILVSHCCNAYGPGQYREKFIPLCTEKVLRGETVQVHARDGVAASRLYIHVDDVAAATLAVLERGGCIADDRTGRYNIVAAQELSNLYVAQEIATILGVPLNYEFVENPPGRPKPDLRYALTGEKLHRMGWRPVVDFESGLRETVEAIRGKLAA